MVRLWTGVIRGVQTMACEESEVDKGVATQQASPGEAAAPFLQFVDHTPTAEKQQPSIKAELFARAAPRRVRPAAAPLTPSIAPTGTGKSKKSNASRVTVTLLTLKE
ncbi:hypothetical protein E2C01_072981 [Portunus trituberculatus]|uniref:Uncharacterized protein n=1 Tax=Portunus trituberculatus TaxID=210409 RepID=A0A5B7ICU6_PORTR|nr:hypothetical protein [Portunus trituberculatus]